MTEKENIQFFSDEWDKNFNSKDTRKGQSHLNNECCKELVNIWMDAAIKFRSKDQNDCCNLRLESLLHFFLETWSDKSYIVSKNAMFGDLVEIRTEGFEKRYLHNVKIFKTYIEAYDKTEEEYMSNFGKRRYSSHDSFRQVRKRYIKR